MGIVLTDAVSNRDADKTIPEAEKAHAEEINMFTVGFTSMCRRMQGSAGQKDGGGVVA